MSNRPKAIVVLGPTSSGKTELALRLAKRFNGVIISADSRQIYRGLDIATAKPTAEQQKLVPHYMIDILEPTESFSVSLYQASVYNLLKSIVAHNTKRSRQAVPFLVGGTGLYIQAVVDGYKIPRVPADPKLRASLDRLSTARLYARLRRLDPQTTVDRHNRPRIIRAIEVHKTVGKVLPKSEAPEFDWLQIGIRHSRDALNRRIEDKVDQMHTDGLAKEARTLAKKGYDFRLPALSALGYTHLSSYLKGRISLREALDLMKRDTKRFAKRQMTWFKRDRRIHWVDNDAQAEALVKKFLAT